MRVVLMVALATVAIVLIVLIVREPGARRRAGRREPAPTVTVAGLTALAAQIERLHALHAVGLLSDADLARAELALLDTVPDSP